MNILIKHKLLRTVYSTIRQFAALTAVIIVGSGLFISLNAVCANLRASIESFNEGWGYADHCYNTAYAPEEVVKQIRKIDGVLRVTGRVQKDVQITPDGQKRATGRLTGYPQLDAGCLNRPYALTGKCFDENETGALLSPNYANTIGLSPGTRLSVAYGGRTTVLNIMGTAVSPEFLLVSNNELVAFEGAAFGIIMTSLEQAQEILGAEDCINQVLIKFSHSADRSKVQKEIEKILEPFGLKESISQENFPGSKRVKSMLESLETASRILPVIFFAIAVCFIFILISQLIKSQRTQIGVMKAIGYNSRAITAFYTAYSLMVCLLGSVLGAAAAWPLSGFLLDKFAAYFNLPYTVQFTDWTIVIMSAAISILTGVCQETGEEKCARKRQPP
jgi:putative ABC transport system permease protein